MELHGHATTLERGGAVEKLAAVRAVLQVGGVRAAGLLARALAHEKDAAVGAALVRGLAELGLRRSLPAIEKALHSGPALADAGGATDSFAGAVVDALAQYASPGSLPTLVRYLENPRAERNVLPRVARLVATLGETGEFHVLRRALDLRSPLWPAAIQALGLPRFRIHASALAALLTEADAHQALLVLRTLGAMGARDQASAVRRFLSCGVIQDSLARREVEEVLESLERAGRARVPAAEKARRP